MKTNILTFLLLLLATYAPAQTGTPISELYPKGKFMATCATEIVNRVTIRHCALCTNIIDPTNQQVAQTEIMQMTFQNDSLFLNRAGILSKVPISRNKDNHSFTFVLNDKTH